MEVEDKKRPAETPVDGAPAPKKAATPMAEGKNGPITFEDIELFQKEALYRQMNVYKRERDTLQGELEALKSDNVDESLRNELQKVNELYLQAQKALERFESPALLRCTMDNKPKKETKEESEEGEKTQKVDEDTLRKLEEAQQGLVGVTAVADKRAAQLEQQAETLASMETKVRQLEVQLVSLPEEQIRQYDSVKAVEKRVQDLTADNVRLEQELLTLNQSVTDIRAEQAAYEHSIREQYESRKTELEKKVETAEADVARIRAARDDILGELNIAKANDTEKAKSTEHLKELLEAAELRIKAVTRDGPPEVDAADLETLGESELREKALKLARQNKALAAEIPGLEQAFTKAQAKTLGKINDQAAIEAKINALSASKAKADEKYFGAMRARDAVNLELSKVKSSLAKTAEVVSGLKDVERKLTSDISRLQRQIGESNNKLSQAQRAQVQSERRKTELESQVEGNKKVLQKIQSQLEQRDAEIKKEQALRRDLETTVEKQKHQLETKRATSATGSAAQLQEQIESLRSIALCSLCSKNWKDTAIKLCGHVFCQDCAQARLSARMRKCPMCNTQFGQNDLLAVHL